VARKATEHLNAILQGKTLIRLTNLGKQVVQRIALDLGAKEDFSVVEMFRKSKVETTVLAVETRMQTERRVNRETNIMEKQLRDEPTAKGVNILARNSTVCEAEWENAKRLGDIDEEKGLDSLVLEEEMELISSAEEVEEGDWVEMVVSIAGKSDERDKLREEVKADKS